MTRGINKRNPSSLVVYLVGTDVLGDTAGFAGLDLAVADGVEKRGFAVVDVA